MSSTWLILLQTNAGEVIKAFGGFVIRGNYVVGAGVFLVREESEVHTATLNAAMTRAVSPSGRGQSSLHTLTVV